MKLKLLKQINNIFYLILFFGGIFIILWVIWGRFIRERLPKDIPFELSERGFYILLYICCLFLFLIIINLFEFKSNPNSLIKKFIDVLYKPLIIVDENIKNNSYIKPYYNKFINLFIKRIGNWSLNDMSMIYICYTILPRLVLINLLLFDVFIMHKLELIYSFVFLGIISLMHRYLKYSVKYAKDQYIKALKDCYFTVWLIEEQFSKGLRDWRETLNMPYHDVYMSIEDYIKFDIESSIDSAENKLEYDINPRAKESFVLQYLKKINKTEAHELTQEDDENINKLFFELMPKITNLSIYLDMYTYASSKKPIKYVKAFIFFLYFICWSYILVKSLPIINFEDFIVTKFVLIKLIPIIIKIMLFTDISDPFSGIFF